MWILTILGPIKFCKGPIKVSKGPLRFGNLHVFDWNMGNFKGPSSVWARIIPAIDSIDEKQLCVIILILDIWIRCYVKRSNFCSVGNFVQWSEMDKFGRGPYRRTLVGNEFCFWSDARR